MAWSLFSFFYSSSYSVLAFILFVLILITPGDAIRQAWNNRQIYNIFIIGGAYVVTFVGAIIMYLARMYRVRKTLADIPKFYLPIKKGDLSVRGYRVVKSELGRSAMVAWESRPRGIPPSEEETDRPTTAEKGKGPFHLRATTSIRKNFKQKDVVNPKAAKVPAWGVISHPDHSPPIAGELNPEIPPDTHFPTVVASLPDILSSHVEAIHPALGLPSKGYSMRSYISNTLVEVGLIEPILGDAFLLFYEKAKFSNDAITSEEFAQLTQLLASILRGISEKVEIAPDFGKDYSDLDGSSRRPSYAGSFDNSSGISLQRFETGQSTKSGISIATSAARTDTSLTTDGTTRRRRSTSRKRRPPALPFQDAQRNISNSTVRIYRPGYDSDSSSI